MSKTEYRYSHDLEWGERDDLVTPLLLDGREVGVVYIDNDGFHIEIYDPAAEPPTASYDAAPDAWHDYHEYRTIAQFGDDSVHELVRSVMYLRFSRAGPKEPWRFDEEYFVAKTGAENRAAKRPQGAIFDPETGEWQPVGEDDGITISLKRSE